MATWTSTGADVGTNSVQDMHDNHAANGDTITMPTGTFNWSTGVTISKAVTLTSTLVPANTDGGIAAGNFIQPTTIIQFGSGALTTGGSSPLIQVNASSAGSITLAGLNFQQGSVSGNAASFLQTNGTTAFPILMHDCMFSPNGNGQLLHTAAWFSGNGVIWHCHINGTGFPGTGTGGIYFEGNLPWWQQDTFGSLDTTGILNVYFESCLFSNVYNQCLDFGESARGVVRNCVVNNSQFLTHGATGISGGRQVELYNNAFNFYPVLNSVNGNSGAWNQGTGTGQTNSDGSTWVPMVRWMWFRAGTGRIHDNTVEQIYSFGFFGTAAMVVLTDESLNRANQAPNGCINCETTSNYPGWHWSGTSGSVDPASPHLNDGTYTNCGNNYSTSGYEIVNPVYLWNNTFTGNGVLPVASQVGFIDGSPPNCPNGGSTSSVCLAGRDFFTNTSPATGAGHGPLSSANLQTYTYAAFQYPHPLRSGSGPVVPNPPVLSSIISGPTASFVQANGFVVTTTATSNLCAYPGAQASGNCNLVFVWTDSNNTIQNVTDTKGNTYTPLYSVSDPSVGQWQIGVYISNGIVAAITNSNTVTASLLTSTWSEMIVVEYTGITVSNPSDVNSNGSGTGTIAASSITVGVNNLIVSWAGYGFPVIGITTPSNWNQEFSTSPQTGTANLADIQVYGGSGTYNPVWTLASSKQWAVVNVALNSTLNTAPPQTTINLAWVSVPGASGYNLYYGTTNPVTVGNSTKVILGNVTSYTLSGLPGGTYYLVVTSTNSVGESAFSNQVSATVPGVSTPIRGQSNSRASTFNPRLILRPITGRF